MAVGMSVTLRGQRMYHFFDKLVSTTLARIRDFRGVSADSFDGCGNYSLGLKDQTVFPEIEYDKVDKVRGLQINVITTAKNDEEGKRFLEMMGMPFKRSA
jgi:large subunit ribosomal protein L5